MGSGGGCPEITDSEPQPVPATLLLPVPLKRNHQFVFLLWTCLKEVFRSKNITFGHIEQGDLVSGGKVPAIVGDSEQRAARKCEVESFLFEKSF